MNLDYAKNIGYDRPSRIKDISGMEFGLLTVIKLAPKINNHAYWVCQCKCGVVKKIRGSHLKNGSIKSCGCDQYNIKHGKCGSREYNSWDCMIQRCTNPKNTSYKNYGARGIGVCDEWLEFENFYRDMGDRPAGTSLERKDVNGMYCKTNCVWATKIEQCRNVRPGKTNTTGVVGVTWSKSRKKYVAQICVGKKTIPLGRYDKKEDAIAARKNAERKYW